MPPWNSQCPGCAGQLNAAGRCADQECISKRVSLGVVPPATLSPSPCCAAMKAEIESLRRELVAANTIIMQQSRLRGDAEAALAAARTALQPFARHAETFAGLPADRGVGDYILGEGECGKRDTPCSEPNCAEGYIPSQPDGDPVPCPRCSGAPENPPGSSAEKRVAIQRGLCPRCSGSGLGEDGACPGCAGTGRATDLNRLAREIERDGF